MVGDPIGDRYAQALFETAKAEGRMEECLETLRLIGKLLREHEAFRELLFNPDVDPEDKVGVLERVLQGTWPKLAQVFLAMVVSLDRSDALLEIIAAFEARVDADAGRMHVTVRSAHPLSDAALHRLQGRLERREGKRIELRVEAAPELLGGLQLVLDHRVIDASVRRQLDDLRQQLTSVRVH